MEMHSQGVLVNKVNNFKDGENSTDRKLGTEALDLYIVEVSVIIFLYWNTLLYFTAYLNYS